MELQAEWLEFLGLLLRHGVRFVMVGGLAVGAHGRVRYTKDLDVLVEPALENARRLRLVLVEFGFVGSSRSWRQLAQPYQILTMGREPLRIDILTGIAGMTFERVWEGRILGRVGKLRIPIIGLADLRANKVASGRNQDLRDVALIDELLAVKATPAAARSRSKRRRRAAPPSRTRGKAGPKRRR